MRVGAVLNFLVSLIISLTYIPGKPGNPQPTPDDNLEVNMNQKSVIQHNSNILVGPVEMIPHKYLFLCWSIHARGPPESP